MSEEKAKPRVWWVFPGSKYPYLEPSVINAPPDIWQDQVSGARVAPEFRKQFIKVVEVIPGVIDVPLD